MAEAEASGGGVAELIGNIALSWRARFFIFGILIVLTAASLVMIYFGVTDETHYAHWVEPAIDLLGVVLPSVIIVAVLALADGGDQVVQNRTYGYMTRTLPRILLSIGETGDRPVPFLKLRRQAVKSGVSVDVHQYLGSCIGRYALGLPDGRCLRFDLEINVRKANLVLLLPRARIGGATPDEAAARAKAMLSHSLGGAALEGYQINSHVGHGHDDQGEHLLVVLVRTLDPKFLNSPYARVYFAQDLMFFLKSVLSEAPVLFAPEREAP